MTRWQFFRVQRVDKPVYEPRWSDGYASLVVVRRETYLWRLNVIETPLFSVKIHKICSPDGDKEMHDHPWSFISIVLLGAYYEERPARDAGGSRKKPSMVGCHYSLDRVGVPMIQVRLIRWLNFGRAEQLHRISSLLPRSPGRPVWTLVLCGPRRREWGFVGSNGAWVHWREWLRRRSEM